MHSPISVYLLGRVKKADMRLENLSSIFSDPLYAYIFILLWLHATEVYHWAMPFDKHTPPMDDKISRTASLALGAVQPPGLCSM